MKFYDNMISFGSEEHHREIAEICKQLEARFDIHHFSYAITDRTKGAELVSLCNEPEVIRKYFDEKMYHGDGVIRQLFLEGYEKRSEHIRVTSPYYQLLTSKRLHKLFISGLQSLGVEQSLNLTFVTQTQYHHISFGSKCASAGYIEFLLSEMDELKRFSDLFYLKMRDVFDDLRKYAVKSSQFKSLQYIKPILERVGIKLAYDNLREEIGFYQPKAKDAVNLNQLYLSEDQAYKVNKLSKRESECLKLYANGLTAKEIGGSLYLSIRTVQNHLYNARKKLNFKDSISFYNFLKEISEKEVVGGSVVQ